MITLINGLPQGCNGLIVPSGSITFQLNVDATIIASPYGFVAANEEIVFQFNSAGQIQPNPPAIAAQIYSNLELTPQNSNGLGTYYLVTFYDANGARINKNPMWWQFIEPANSTVDISEMTAYSTVGGNVIFYPIPFGGGGSGSVTSVSFTGDGVLFQAAAGTPVTSVGTLTPVLIIQQPNTVLAGPASGSSATPTFRPLVSADLPGLGTNAQVSDFSLTGWGSGASVSAVRGYDRGHVFTITVGASPSANPTVLYTFANGAQAVTPVVQAQIRGGTGEVSDLQVTESTSAYVLTFLGVPIAGQTYSFSAIIMSL